MNGAWALADPLGMLSHAFMRDAFLAGTGVALASGLVGFFLVLRSQVFTGDALSHVAFTGALAALAAGVDLRLGLFVATVGVGILLGVLGPRGRADDVVIGSVFAWVLGLGVLFLGIYTTTRSTAGGNAGVSVLFGSIFGLSSSSAVDALVVGAGLSLVMVVAARPLLFATVDPAVAAARGVPVRPLGIGFLAVVGATAGEATQAVGALLLLGLLTAPAATALHLTNRPLRAMATAAVLALAEVWAGLTVGYVTGSIPPSVAIVTLAAVVYALVALATRPRRRAPVNAAPIIRQSVP